MKIKFNRVGFGIIFLIFNLNFIFAAYDSPENALNYSIGKSITSSEAALAINESQQIMEEMQSAGFSVIYLNDTLIQARRIFEQARYADILRGDVNFSSKEKIDASNAMSLIDWKIINYGDVLVYTEEIKNRRVKAFLLSDMIKVNEIKAAATSNETRQIFENVKLAFSEERYEEADSFFKEFILALEKEKSDASTLVGLKNGALSFFQKYWIQIIIVLVIFGVILYFIYKHFEKKLLSVRISGMKTEEKVIIGLIKQTQEERFKKNSISGLVYNIRMDKYKKRSGDIKEELPVLEKRLGKL